MINLGLLQFKIKVAPQEQICNLLISSWHLAGLNSSTTLLTCCGAGGPPYNYDFNAGCGLPSVTACANPYQALQWDGFHLTESAYRTVADGWLHGPYADPPIMHVAR